MFSVHAARRQRWAHSCLWLLPLALMALATGRAHAQGTQSIRDYTWTNSTATYTPLAGTPDTEIKIGQAPASVKRPLPFRFPFQGRVYDSVYVCRFGYLYLGFTQQINATPFNSIAASSQVRHVSNAEAVLNPLAGTFTASTATGASAGILISATDTSYIVEYRDVSLAANTGLRLNFQIALFASGTIHFNYGPAVGSATTAQLLAGIRGTNSNDLLALTNGSGTTSFAMLSRGTSATSPVYISSSNASSLADRRISFTAPVLPAPTFALLPYNLGFEDEWLTSSTVSNVKNDRPSASASTFPRSSYSSLRRCKANGHIGPGTGTLATDTVGSGWINISGNTGSFSKVRTGSYAARYNANNTGGAVCQDLDIFLNMGQSSDEKMVQFYTASAANSEDLGIACFISTDGGRLFDRVVPHGSTDPYVSYSNTWSTTAWNKHLINLGRVQADSVVFRIRIIKQTTLALSNLFIDDFSATACSLPTPRVSIYGNTTFCQGGSLTLEAPSGYDAYLWNDGSTSAVKQVSSGGLYSVRVISGGCTSQPSNYITVTVNDAPAQPTITADGPTTFCTGDFVTLSAPAGFGAYLWSNGESSESIMVFDPGNYSVRTYIGGCASPVSATTVVDVLAPPSQPTIIPDGPTTFSPGGSVVLSAPAGYDYLWSNGATTQDITVTTSGSYYVTVSNGYCGTTSAATVVTVEAPAFDLTVTNGQNVTTSGHFSSITVEAGGTLTLDASSSSSGNVTINSGGSLNTNCFILSGAGNFTLNSGGTLHICHRDGIASAGPFGAIQMTGTRSYSTGGNYVYNGSNQGTGNGLPGTVANLTISPSSGNVILDNPTTVTGVAEVTRGSLNTAHQLTLESNAAGTASLLTPDADGTYVYNNVNVRRYVSPSLNAGPGYHHVSFPVVLSSYFPVSAGGAPLIYNTDYNAVPNPGAVTPFPTVFYYDASWARSSGLFSSGWLVPDIRYNNPDGLTGLSIYAPGGTVFSAAGEIYSNSRFMNFALLDGEYALLGNTFTAPILWSALSRSNMAPVVYMAQSTGAYAGRYSSYVAGTGVSTNGGTDTIPSGAGYFVQASGSSPSMTWPLTARVRAASARPVYRQAAQPLARFELMNGTVGDETVIHFHANATAGFDADFDANRMPGGMALYTHSGGKYYSINSNPESFLADGAVHTFALGYTAQNAGTHTIKLKEISALDGQVITLIDNQLNTATVMNAGDEYNFQAAAGSNLTRFVIQVGVQATSAKASIAAGLSVFPNPAKDRLDVSGLGQNASLMLINSVGQTVRTATADYSTSFDLNSLPAGVYTLRIAQDGQVVNQKVVKE